jgi:uncharacterized protein YehS (DUF1456 family)
MPKQGLSKDEIKQRLIRLRNLERLHQKERGRVVSLENEVKLLKQENAFLRSANADLVRVVQDLKLQLEEMKTIVFGKKKTEEHFDDEDIPQAGVKLSEPRTAESYKRKIPNSEEVTETKEYPIDECNRCHGTLSERDSATYYEEDIPLPQKKTVTKRIIEKGYCDSCKKWSSSAPIPSADVVFGNNVKRYATYLSVICRQSYAQIQDILKQTYDFDISQGEISKILEKEGGKLRPEYERLKEKIRGEPSVHLDETSWNLFIGDGFRRFAWTMAGGESSDAVFVLGKTRGKGNADDLLGNSQAIVVSDDYIAYRKLKKHQLCLAHILRKLRDLATSGEVKNEVRIHCIEVYKIFASIYADIEVARLSEIPASSYEALYERLKTFALPHSCDFAKLTRVKKQISERTDNYLTCLRYRFVASDNNLAERSLRHLVLKRKISFGSLSEKTADTLAVLLSVLLSRKRRGMLRDYLVGV